MNLIFDYDGTLNDCMKTYRPAFEKAYKWLEDNGYAEPRNFSDSELSYWLGFTGSEMWATFRPDLPLDIREKCMGIIGSETDRQIRAGNAALYKNAENTLSLLKDDGYNLIFLSNCRCSYISANNSAFGLDRYFNYFYCSEQFGGIPKFEIFRKFKDRHSGEYIVIGDRFHDIETAVKNGLKSIGCAYGYGTARELDGADAIVSDVSEIPSAIKSLCE